MRKNKSLNKKVKIFFNSKNYLKDVNATDILINGKLITCLILSLVSAFIDIVFFSGLSKSGYPFFGLYVSAAIILSIMSIGFSCGKFFVAMQLAAIKEIQSRLITLGYETKKRLRWLKIKWHLIHKFLVSISIITSISLSVITIGNGVRRMEQNIKNMTADTTYLLELKQSIKDGNSEKRNAAKSNITGAINAQEIARAEVERAWERIEAYQLELDAIDADDSLTEEEKTLRKSELRRAAVNRAPHGVVSSNIDYMTETQLRSIMQRQAMSNEVIDNTSIYEEAISYDEEELNSYISALQDKNYKMPDGTPISFLNDDGTPINRDSAISKLQNAIMEWQSDTGDAGASSKVFTLVATYMNVDESAGGLGMSELIMMFLIMIFWIVQEFLIAAFTPKATINRKMLSQFNEYLYDVDVNKFMLVTYTDYYNWGLLTTEEYEQKSKKAVLLSENNINTMIEKYSLKNKNKNEVDDLKSKVDYLQNELDKTKNNLGITQNSLNNIKNEKESVASQLSKSVEKVNELEKKLLEKDNEIANLNKRKIVEKEESSQNIDSLIKEVENLI